VIEESNYLTPEGTPSDPWPSAPIEQPEPDQDVSPNAGDDDAADPDAPQGEDDSVDGE
jgi:hypothetical protein